MERAGKMTLAPSRKHVCLVTMIMQQQTQTENSHSGLQTSKPQHPFLSPTLMYQSCLIGNLGHRQILKKVGKKKIFFLLKLLI